MAGCCGNEKNTSRVCPEGARYVEKIMAGPTRTAVLACEGGCLKGEIARVAANILAYRLERETAVRICLGDAATGDSGFAKLIEIAPKTIVIEGCFMHCGTQLIKTRWPDFEPDIVESSRFLNFDRDKQFEIFDMPREEIERSAKQAAEYVRQTRFQVTQNNESGSGGKCCDKPVTVADLTKKFPALLNAAQREGAEDLDIIHALAECGYGFTEVADIIRAQNNTATDLTAYYSSPVSKISQCL